MQIGAQPPVGFGDRMARFVETDQVAGACVFGVFVARHLGDGAQHGQVGDLAQVVGRLYAVVQILDQEHDAQRQQRTDDGG